MYFQTSMSIHVLCPLSRTPSSTSFSVRHKLPCILQNASHFLIMSMYLLWGLLGCTSYILNATLLLCNTLLFMYTCIYTYTYIFWLWALWENRFILLCLYSQYFTQSLTWSGSSLIYSANTEHMPSARHCAKLRITSQMILTPNFIEPTSQ